MFIFYLSQNVANQVQNLTYVAVSSRCFGQNFEWINGSPLKSKTLSHPASIVDGPITLYHHGEGKFIVYIRLIWKDQFTKSLFF